MPNGWLRGTFGDCIALDLVQASVDEGREYPVVGVLGFGRGLLSRSPVTSVTTRYKSLNRVRPDQLVYSKLKAFEGAITVVPSDQPESYASQEFPTFTLQDSMLPDYLRLVTQQPSLWEALARDSKGIGGRRERLNPKDLLNVPLTIPPLGEQRRIVDLIGTLDDAVKQGTEAAVRLELLWWRLADDLRVSVSGLPVKLLGEIADIGGGLTKNKKDAEHPDALEVPYLRVANVLRRRLDLRDIARITAPRHRIEAARLLPGDVLMNEGGDRDKLGRGAVWRGAVKDCTHQNHVFRVRVRDDRFSPEFLSAWANSFGQKWFETHGTQTTGIASINKSTLGRFPVPDMDLPEQQRWAELLQGVTDQEDEHRAQARRLQRLRSSLLDALLSGAHEIPESYDELTGVAS